MTIELIRMIIQIILIVTLIINIIYTYKLVKAYKINTEVCTFLLKSWKEKGVYKEEK